MGGRSTWLVILAGMVSGCGDNASTSSSGGYGAEYLERALPQDIDQSLARMTGVTCVKKSDRTFRCLATVHPTAKAIRDEYKDYNPGPLSSADIRLLRRRETQRLVYEVTVDPDTGKYVFEAQ